MGAELAVPESVKIIDNRTGRVLNGPPSTWTRVKEFITATLSVFPGTGLRSRGLLSWVRGQQLVRAPAYDGTTVTYDLARQLYRNDGSNSSLGAGFARPIVDLLVEFMGLPRFDSENPERDDRVNDCISIYWADVLMQVLRNSIRDSKTYVRIKKDSLLDPLMTIEEIQHGRLEVLDPERVFIERDFNNNNIVKQMIVVHRIQKIEEVGGNSFDPSVGSMPTIKEHEIWEVVTREETRYWDRTDQTWLVDQAIPNPWGFVAIEEWFNEYDSTLSGGQSALESCFPFMTAFHDVLRQVLGAHKYHSNPKLKFKLADVAAFIEANFPDAWDATNQRPVPGAKISYSGLEVYLLGDEDDVDTVNIVSVLGDSIDLLKFLFDCICIASETPRFAFMQSPTQNANTAELLPFEKKVERYRINHGRHFQNLVKMYLKMNGEPPVRGNLTWPEVRVEDLAAKMQAFQLFVMGAELLQQKQLVSDETVQTGVRHFLPWMKNPDQEATDAKDNVLPELVSPAGVPSTSPTPSANGKVKVAQGQQGRNE